MSETRKKIIVGGGLLQKRIGRYEIEHEVGAGGLGKVYRAVDPENGQLVAVKVLHEKYQKSKRFLGIFHRELLMVSRLKHKHIVGYIDASYRPPHCYIVTEFVDGWSLHRLMKHFGKMPPLVALSITIDILQGIDYLHLHDTIHSDLSSPNVMIGRNGRVMLTDFGLACNGEFENYKNYMIGTPGYYSPEHITDAAIQVQSDIYCVGLILYEMVTGDKAVLASKRREEILPTMRSIDFSKIVCSDRRMQSMLRAMLKKSLAYNINRRTPSAERMIYDVFKILKRHEIRYARHAIHQFLGSRGLSLPIPANYEQDILQGFIAADEGGP